MVNKKLGCIFLMALACFAFRHEIDEEIKKGNELALNIVEYALPEEKKTFYNQLFFIGNPTPSIKFNLEFSNVDEKKTIDPNNHYVMIEPVGGDFVVDCDKARKVGTVTKKLNSFIISGEKSKGFTTGFVAVYACNKSPEDFKIKGTLNIENPHGFLDSRYFGYIPFECMLTMMYLNLSAFWVIVMLRNTENIMFHHKMFTAILIGTCIDEAFTTFMLNAANANIKGPASFLIVSEAIFHGLREALVRYIGLMMSRGWGMAEETIDDKWKLQAYCSIYCVIRIIYGVKWGPAQHCDPIYTIAATNVVLILCTFDALWATYVLSALSLTFNKLHESQQHAKALFYERVSYIIMGAIGGGVLLSFFSIGFLNTSWRNDFWTQTWWYVEGCWRCEFALILMAFLYVFRPQKGSKAYAQSKQLPTAEEFGLEEFDCETRSLHGGEGESTANTTDASHELFLKHAPEAF